MPYMVLYGCSAWPEAAWLEVALLAPAHPAATIATAASAVVVRMQDNERLKDDPPIDRFSTINGRIWRPQGKWPVGGTLGTPHKMARGPARYAEPLMVIFISQPVSRVL